MASKGRPKKRKEDSQNECVSVWMLPSEKEMVQKAAKGADVPTSLWARKALRDAARRALEAMGL